MKNILSRKGIALICLTLVALVLVWEGIVTHQRLAVLEKLVATEWANTDKAYQYRADLVPQLLKAASVTPNFDSAATNDLLHAQAEVEKLKLDPTQVPTDASLLSKYDQAQAVLTNSLFHVDAVPMVHRDVKVTADFRNLASQVLNIQTNVSVARNRFNGAAQTYDQYVHGFPDVLYATAFGFKSRPYFPQEGGNNLADSGQH